MQRRRRAVKATAKKAAVVASAATKSQPRLLQSPPAVKGVRKPMSAATKRSWRGSKSTVGCEEGSGEDSCQEVGAGRDGIGISREVSPKHLPYMSPRIGELKPPESGSRCRLAYL